MSGGRSSVFRHYAEALNGKPRALNLLMVSEGKSWQNELALFRMTAAARHLEEARRGADRYIRERISRPPTDFSDVHVEQGGQFWTDFAPKWIDLFELYDETKDARYLDAAAAGAREYATLSWFQPAIPDSDVVVNPHGQVGVHTGMKGEQLTKPMQVPEQSVPAWRVSQIGLIPEASTTYTGNPAIFLAHHAAYMLRIGAATKDPFLTAVARSAIVGRVRQFSRLRYQRRIHHDLRAARLPAPSFPGDDVQPDLLQPRLAADRPGLRFPDFRCGDAIGRKIDFPSRYAQGYAYLQSKVYGDRPGTFYGNSGSAAVDAREAAAHRQSAGELPVWVSTEMRLYIALSNQSNKPVTAHIRVNPDLAPYSVRREYGVRTWSAAGAGPAGKLREGEIRRAGPGVRYRGPGGRRHSHCSAVSAGDIRCRSVPLADQSYAEAASPFGKVTGMLLAFGGSNNTAYVWLEATEQQLRSARLHYRFGTAEWNVVEDTRYPYDFSLPDAGRCLCILVLVGNHANRRLGSEVGTSRAEKIVNEGL